MRSRLFANIILICIFITRYRGATACRRVIEYHNFDNIIFQRTSFVQRYDDRVTFFLGAITELMVNEYV